MAAVTSSIQSPLHKRRKEATKPRQATEKSTSTTPDLDLRISEDLITGDVQDKENSVTNVANSASPASQDAFQCVRISNRSSGDVENQAVKIKSKSFAMNDRQSLVDENETAARLPAQVVPSSTSADDFVYCEDENTVEGPDQCENSSVGCNPIDKPLNHSRSTSRRNRGRRNSTIPLQRLDSNTLLSRADLILSVLAP